MNIRQATLADESRIREIYQQAFDDPENRLVARLARELLKHDSAPPCLNLVAETDGQVHGHVTYSPIHAREDGSLAGYILAPLAVAPTHQRQGIGKELVTAGLDKLRSAPGEVILVYGDPAYYGRFGFHPGIAAKYVPPYDLEFPHGWLGLPLIPGRVAPDPKPIQCVSPLNKPELW